MNKVTVKLENNFTTIPNEIIRNKKMSCNAKAILITMLSLPPDWDFTINGLTSILKESRNTIAKVIQELEDFGYIDRERERKADGSFGGINYTVYQFPQEKVIEKNKEKRAKKVEKSTSQPNPKKPTLDFSRQLNKDNNNIDSNNDIHSNSNINKLNTDTYTSCQKSANTFSEKKTYTSTPKGRRWIASSLPDRVTINHKLTKYAKENEIDDKQISDFLDIFIYYYSQYQKYYGYYQKPLTLEKTCVIYEEFLGCLGEYDLYDDIKAIKWMINEYFITEFNVRGRYDGEINKTFAHFMSNEIFYRIFERYRHSCDGNPYDNEDFER